ncbi:MAG: peroxiredoxin [Cyclobacteriaceae bacterium]|nr:peroxiredoxin [Cyclobacteriaceae bacterium]
MSHIKIGDKLPSFQLPDQNGEVCSIDEIRNGKNLVLYFYPKDETLVCTRQACAFRDNYEVFKENECEVVGISSDSPESHQRFATNHNLSFTLLSDTDNKVRKLLGVPRDMFGLLSGRYTYVINKNGLIVHIFNDHFSAARHIDEALKALQNERKSN